MSDKEAKIREMFEKDEAHIYFNNMKETLQVEVDDIDHGLYTAEYLEILEGIMMLSLEELAEVESLMQEFAKRIRDRLKELKE